MRSQPSDDCLCLETKCYVEQGQDSGEMVTTWPLASHLPGTLPASLTRLEAREHNFFIFFTDWSRNMNIKNSGAMIVWREDRGWSGRIFTIGPGSQY